MCAIGRSLLYANKLQVSHKLPSYLQGLFEKTLQWGKPNATDEDCWEALAIAQCKEFVEQLDQG